MAEHIKLKKAENLSLIPKSYVKKARCGGATISQLFDSETRGNDRSFQKYNRNRRCCLNKSKKRINT